MVVVVVHAMACLYCSVFGFFFQAEDGIRDLVRSRGLGDVYKRQVEVHRRLRLTGGAGGEAEQRHVVAAGGDGGVLHLSLIHI